MWGCRGCVLVDGLIIDYVDPLLPLRQVTATDHDEGNDGVVLFSITSNLVTINEVTGVITTATSFNYEEQQQYNFTVIARGWS